MVDRPPTTVSNKKLESLGYHVALFADPIFSRFDTIPACDRQTDGQTDYTMTASTALAECRAGNCT